MKNVSFPTPKSPILLTAIFEHLISCGYRIYSVEEDGVTVKEAAKYYCSHVYSYLTFTVNDPDHRVQGCGADKGENISIEQIFELEKIKQNVKIKLNVTYEAEVLPNGDVKVGCQTFKAEKILEVAKAVKEAQKS